jgi:hypothetical protein
MALGTIYVEMDLSLDKYEKNQAKILTQARSTALSIEKNYQILGVTSDNIFQAMANGAINAYTRITAAAGASAAEQVRVQAAMVAKINQLNQDMAKNPLYETLGIRSVAAINAQKDAVISSFNTISATVQKGSQDWINIERAKNAKLKELNAEMKGEHEMSLDYMMRSLLRFYAAWYVLSSGVQFAATFVMSGVKAIDEMKMSVIGVAAQLTTMQGSTGDITKNYRENVKYAEALVPVLQQVDANSLANLSQIMKMNTAMAMQGFILDVNSKKQIESFTALTNAVALFTQGQDKEKQASQEIRALMSGQVRDGNMVALQMDQQIRKQGQYKDGLKGLLDYAKKEGIAPLILMEPYLKGIIAASGDIGMLWESVSSSLETSWKILQRGLFKGVYKDLTESGREFSAWIKKNEQEILTSLTTIKNALTTASEWTLLSLAALSLWFKGFGATVVGVMGLFSGAWATVWATMATVLTATTSKMLIGWNLFGAALAGFAFGNWLQKEFEAVRLAGVHMVYGIMGVWDWMVAKMRTGWEYFKLGAEIIAQPLKAKELIAASQQRIALIKSEYETESAMRDQNYKDQLKDETDYEKNYQKLKAEWIAKEQKIGVPGVGKGTTELDTKILSAREQLQEEIRKNQIKIDQVDIDSYENALVRIKSEYEKRVKETQDVVSAKKWALQEVELAARKHDDERSKRELKLAEEFVKVEDRFILAGWKADEELTKKQEKSLEDYNKMVAYNAEEALTDHDRAMNRINGRAAAMQKIIDKEREIGTTSEDVLRAQEKINAAIIAQWKAEENIKKLKGEADFYSNIRGFEDEAFDRRMKQIDAEYTANEKLYNAKIALEMKTQSIIAARSKQWDDENKNIKDIMASTEDMFGSAAEMFDKESSQYKTLMQIKQVMHTAELAMNVAKQVSNYQTLISEIAKAKAAGGTAVAAQGQIPVVGFAMAAAMAAMLASLFSTLGFSFGSGGSASAPSAAYGRGTTTFGGANDSGSESIGNSFKLMEDTYDLQKVTLTGIYDNMKQLNANITGIVRAVVSGNMGNMTTGQVGDTYLKLGQALGNIPYIGSVLDKVSSWVFGGSKTTAIGSGIMVGDGAVNPYYETRTDKKGILGIGGGSSTSRSVGTVDEVLTNLFYGERGVYTTLKDSVSEMATMLGGDVAKAEAKVFEAFELNFIGKTAEEIEKMVASKISEIGDNFAREVFGNLVTTYQQVGEGALETVSRLAIDLQSVTGILEMTGKTMTSVIPNAIALSEGLIEIAGGLDKLTEAANTYYDKFFTDTEKQAKLLKDITTATGHAPTTRADWRADIERLQSNPNFETSESLQKQWYSMIQWSGLASDFFDVIEEEGMPKLLSATELLKQQRSLDIRLMEAQGDAAGVLAANRADELAATDALLRPTLLLIYAQEDLNKANEEALRIANERKGLQDQLDNLTMTELQLRAKERAALDSSNWALFDQIHAIEDLNVVREKEIAAAKETANALLSNAQQNVTNAENALRAAFDAEKTRISEAYQKQIDAANKSLQTTEDIVSDLEGVMSSLKSAREGMVLEGQDLQAFQQANLDVAAALAKAKTGDFSWTKDLGKSIGVSATVNPGLYATRQEYERAYYLSYNQLSELEALTGNQLTAQEEAVINAKKIVDSIEEARDRDLQALDHQLNTLLSINDSILTIPVAISGLNAAIVALAQAKTSAVTGTPSIPARTGAPSTAWNEAVYLSMNPDVAAAVAKGQIKSGQEHYNIWGRNEGRASTTQYGFNEQSYLTNNIDVARAVASGVYTSGFAHYLSAGIYEGRLPYAYGGIATGPDSGYGATLHGTELIVSPKASYPATVKGGDNVVLISEIKALREEMKVNLYSIAKNTAKVSKVIDRFDQDGLPPDRDGIIAKWDTVGIPATRP